MRPTLSENQVHSEVKQIIGNFHRDVIVNIENSIKENEWVIVGMTGNPFVIKAKKHLNAKDLNFKYIEQGSYMSQWKQRLAIKLWSGWPTFPQVFHKGKLIGGFNDLKKYLP